MSCRLHLKIILQLSIMKSQIEILTKLKNLPHPLSMIQQYDFITTLSAFFYVFINYINIFRSSLFTLIFLYCLILKDHFLCMLYHILVVHSKGFYYDILTKAHGILWLYSSHSIHSFSFCCYFPTPLIVLPFLSCSLITHMRGNMQFLSL